MNKTVGFSYRKLCFGLLASTAWSGSAYAQNAVDYSCGSGTVVYNRTPATPLVGTGSRPYLSVIKNSTPIVLSTDAFSAFGYNGVAQNGDGGSNAGFAGHARDGDPGLDGFSVGLVNCAPITTTGHFSYAIEIYSPAGNGGTGGDGGSDPHAGSGGNGGNGGNISISTNSGSSITTGGSLSSGIFALSMGGNGGNGGSGSYGDGGNGAVGGNGGTVIIGNHGSILTRQSGANGISARSVGGQAGDGTSGFFGKSGSGSVGGAGSDVTALNTGAISTFGNDTSSILLESIGGQGGDGGNSFGLIVSIGGAGGIGGHAGAVSATNSGNLNTSGDNAKGINVHAIGGGGGHGGDAFNVGAFGGVAVGGSGGGGGHGGDVSVGNSGTILTSGRGSHAIIANSIGGGGGDGGSASGVTIGGGVAFQVSVGGSGGNGGNGGDVLVSADAFSSIRTGSVVSSIAGMGGFSGDTSSAIVAQSIGGGGGHGGRALAVAASASTETPSISVAVGIGGSGGSGGVAGDVTTQISQGSTIMTSGRSADAVVSQSIGGGGGSGGSVITVAASVSEVAGAVSVAVGGKGGSGGSGGDASIVTKGSVSTLSNMSNGLVARSVGGGGGGGGNVIDIAATLGKYSGSIAVGVGGTGGSGGSGMYSSVTNEGSVSTAGHRSHAIVSQSIGGGGGSGGNVHTYAVAASVGGGSNGLAASASVGVGGVGGNGAEGSQAQVTHSGHISTSGDLSNGVLVQSIGGGGGDGGNVFALSIAASLDKPGGGGGTQGGRNLSAAVAVGGNGGAGGAGGSVYYTGGANATITTGGVRAFGISAQSIGGGGGNGGNAHSFDVSSSVPVDPSRLYAVQADFLKLIGPTTEGPQPEANTKNGFAASISVGGNGGSGNIGGLVSVLLDPTTIIKTGNSHSYGIFAQSIGGGGGSGGYAHSDGFVGIDSYGLIMSIGGNGGTGGHGDSVSVIADAGSGSITTAGDHAHGILAQSVGGGGGEGGQSSSSSNGVPLLSKKTVSISIGGQGQSAGDGGDVNVDHSFNILTAGDLASAIVAQSVGGGGGIGASSMTGGVLQFGLGGSGGAAGDGGKVTLIGASNIVTQGRSAHGLIAQSVGGGGGVGGNAGGTSLLGLSVRVDLGGGGGGGGHGGAVTVSRNGSILTNGDSAFGILAQSVGGGGGVVAASTLRLVQGDIPIMGNLIGSNGVGGDVTVKSGIGTLDITTGGISAHGIVAQSVGGGGGIVVLASRAGLSLEPANPGGPATSTAGNVNVGITGNILTKGDYAYGIFAQSLNGGLTLVSGSGTRQISNNTTLGHGVVTVDQAGTLETRGIVAHGIVAMNANKTLDLTSAPATNINVGGQVSVSGGSSWGIIATNGYSATPNYSSSVQGTTINIAAGASVIAKGDAVGFGGGIQINDYLGLSRLSVSGLLDAGNGTALKSAGPLSFTVAQGGRVFGDVAGGSGNFFSVQNHGLISGSLTGANTYTLGAGAQHLLAIDPLRTAKGNDSLATQNLILSGGTIRPYLTSLPYGPLALVNHPIVTAGQVTGNLSEALLTGSLSTNFAYSVSGNAVTVTGVSIDFTRAGLAGNDASLARLATSTLGDWINVIANSGYDYLNDVLLSAANSNSQAELSKIFEDFDASTHYSTGGFLILSQQSDQGSYQSCGAAIGSFVAIQESNCNWARVSFADSELRGGHQNQRATTLSFGRQTEVSPNLFLGYGAGYENNDYEGLTSTANGDRLFAGVIAKSVHGPLLLSGSLSASYGWSNGARVVAATGDTALSKHSTMGLSTRLRSVYLLEVGRLNVMPMIELDMSLIKDAGYREVGARAFNLRQQSKTHFVADVRPALRLGSDIKAGSSVVRAYVEGGARFALNDLSFDVHLPDAPQEHDSVNLKMGRDKVVGTLAAGLSLLTGKRFEISGRYEASLGKETRSHMGSLKFGLKF